MLIHILTPTRLKMAPLQSAQLPPFSQAAVPAGTVLTATAVAQEGDHLRLRLVGTDVDVYAWPPHVRVDEAEAEAPEPTPTLDIPGRTIRLTQPIVPNGHFSWAEATRNGERLPTSEAIVQTIIQFASTLEEVRTFVGGPMVVTSWYRPPHINKAVGGAANSRHLHGDAVDFWVPGANLQTLYARLDPWWGNRGGLAQGQGFIHIDARGHKARWRY